MEWLLAGILRRIVSHGRLSVVMASGARHVFGDGSGLPVALRFTDRGAQWGFVLDPYLKMGELFMDGRIVVEEGDIYQALDLLLGELRGKREPLPVRLLHKLRFTLRRFAQRNGLTRSRQNVAHHYDLDGRLYDLFLDDDRQYSCAYYDRDGLTLEEAQAAKRRHIAAKLVIRGGERVLDIGSGWGGLGLYLAGVAGAREVLGVTLSEEQLALARRRAEEGGLADRVNFELRDYRTLDGAFDRIVSVGMFEHVGVTQYRTFFEKARDLLAPDGVMLLHTIGLSDGPWFTNPWIDKYIFPGGALPALSEMLPLIEKAGLVVTDVEVLRLHYAFTLRDWRERFLARREEAARLYDERFCRMWEFYLAACEAAFRHQGAVVFQLQLARRQEAVPLTRGYIETEEAALERRERCGGLAAAAE